MRVFFNFLRAVINDVVNVIDNNASGIGNVLDSAVALDASRLAASALLGIGFRFGHG
ncbi:MAG: hypothetical protein NTU96_08985 [Actinobacteria bacterium]|nr:hypothetical protein [Actinomycetota bacterium]